MIHPWMHPNFCLPIKVLLMPLLLVISLQGLGVGVRQYIMHRMALMHYLNLFTGYICNLIIVTFTILSFPLLNFVIRFCNTFNRMWYNRIFQIFLSHLFFPAVAYMVYDNNTNKVMMTKRSHLLHLWSIQEQVILIRLSLHG